MSEKSKIALINARIYTINNHFDVHSNGAVVFDDSGILSVGPMETAQIPPEAKIIDYCGRKAILPGLIDTHSHSSLLKGFSENAQLLDWLPEYQREHQVLTDEDAYFSCLLSYLEAVKGGTTLVTDMYRRLDQAAKAAIELGIRVELVPYAADHNEKRFFETLETTRGLIEDWHGTGGGKVNTWVGLEHITYCSKEMYKEASLIANEYGVNIHTHTSEQKEEVQLVLDSFGKRPVNQLEQYGILRPGTVLAHCVWLDHEEIAILAKTGTGVAHCPISNMKLASGTAPLERFFEAGVQVGLGSDGGISNNSLSGFELMKTASLLQKVSQLDATAIPAEKALKLATIDGAKLLGRHKEIGSLEPHKAADLIAIDLWQPHLMPIVSSEGHDPVLWNLVFAARASDVTDVWIQGKQIVKQGDLVSLNEQRLLDDIHRQTVDLLKRREQAKPIPMV